MSESIKLVELNVFSPFHVPVQLTCLPPERSQKFTGFDATIGMLQWKSSM